MLISVLYYRTWLANVTTTNKCNWKKYKNYFFVHLGASCLQNLCLKLLSTNAKIFTDSITNRICYLTTPCILAKENCHRYSLNRSFVQLVTKKQPGQQRSTNSYDIFGIFMFSYKSIDTSKWSELIFNRKQKRSLSEKEFNYANELPRSLTCSSFGDGLTPCTQVKALKLRSVMVVTIGSLLFCL